MKTLHIAFYTEAGTVRGMGHLVRTYCIAQKFKQLGFNVSFFLDSDINFDEKFEGISYFKWQTLHIGSAYNVILIDSYEASIEHYQLIADSCHTPIYIDDYKRLNYPEGIILNFSPDANDSLYQHKRAYNNYLLGLKYIPIREEFLTLTIKKRKQLFIMLGGADVANLSIDLMMALNDINIKKVIVCNNKKIANVLQRLKNVLVLHKPSNDALVEAMANSSIAISTASMAIYELAFLKTPTIMLAVSKNQEIGMPQLIKHRVAQDFVSITDRNWKSAINGKVQTLINTTNNDFNNKIDGKGTNNIVNAILELTI